MLSLHRNLRVKKDILRMVNFRGGDDLVMSNTFSNYFGADGV
jgi:hypothetical protein